MARPRSSKSIKMNPTIKQMKTKTKSMMQMLGVKGQIEKKRKINTQAFAFFIFSTKFVVVVVKKLLMPMLTLHCHCSNDATVQSSLIFLFVDVIVMPMLMSMLTPLLHQNFQSCYKLFFSSILSLVCIKSTNAQTHVFIYHH